MAKIKFILDSRERKDGKNIVMLSFIHKGFRKQATLGIKVSPENWDAENCLVSTKEKNHRGFITLKVEYIDGTKMESKANKYTFVWRKTVEKNRAKLQEKIQMLLRQIDEVIAQEKAAETETAEFTPETLDSLIGELKDALSTEPEPVDKEHKKRHREKKKQIKELEKHRDKLSEYDDRLEQIGERNSMSKTDPDATFMRMKEDAMNNGQTKPGYNLQISAENQFITDFGLFPNPTDTLTLIPFFNSFLYRYGHLPSTAVADAGYGSEENYRFMDEAGMDAYVKYNRFHLEQRPLYKPNPFHHDNFHYNAEEDYYLCPMGQHMRRIGTSHSKTASGYRSENARYLAQNCKGCPLRCRCYKAKDDRRAIEVNQRLNEYKRKARELLTSEDGLKHRGRRCIEPEAVFGQMKFNMAYRRFRHFGKDKVTMDFAFFAIAFNIKKMCSKIAKQAKNGGNTPYFGLFLFMSRLLRMRIEYFGKKAKISRLKNIRTSKLKKGGCAINLNYDTASCILDISQHIRLSSQKFLLILQIKKQ